MGLAWTLPFLQPIHRYPLVSFYSEWLAFALGLAGALVLVSRAAWREASVPVIALAPLALIVVLGVQVLLGRVPYPEQALIATLYLLWAALLVVLGHALGRMGTLAGVVPILAWFLLAGGVLAGLGGLLQHFDFSTPIDFLVVRKDETILYGNLAQSNHFAAYLTLSLASVAYLYSCQRLHAALAACCLAPSLLLLTLTGSRSPWLYLGAFTVLATLLYRVTRNAESRKLIVIVLCLLPGFMVAQLVARLPFMQPAAGQMVTSLQRLFHVASGIEARLQFWQEAWNMFCNAPLLGAGFGQFTWHHFLHQAATGPTLSIKLFNHAHNVVMQLMAEAGLIGALAIVGAMVLWLVDLRRVRFDPERWWLLSLLAVIGIHSMLEFPLWYSYFLGIAALLLGLGAQRTFTLRFAGAARAIAGLIVLLGFVNLAAVLAPYREFERLVFLPQSRVAPLPEAAFAKAIVGLYREPLLVPYVELAIAYGVTVSEDKLPEKLALTSRVVHFAPVAVVAYRHALLLALAGQSEAARIQFERALRVYPEDADEIVAQLETLARDRPDAFSPLLELAAGRRATSPSRSGQNR